MQSPFATATATATAAAATAATAPASPAAAVGTAVKIVPPFATKSHQRRYIVSHDRNRGTAQLRRALALVLLQTLPIS